jgi:acyl transferase domain-containing protein/3-hydroxymyristoyl/3-hydroxydecanoyl-(acyl carrier protein) dehydratase
MQFEPIAIVGRSCVFPGALTPEQLWDNVLAGHDSTGSSPEGSWRVARETMLTPGEYRSDRTPTDRGGFVTGFEEVFDPRGFAVSAAEIAHYDRSLKWLLHTGRAAMRDARVAGGDRVGLTLGLLALPTDLFCQYAESVWMGEPRQEIAVNRFNSGMPAFVVARALGLHPDAFTLDAACASSLYAIRLACDQLQDGRRDVMLAGAVSGADDLFLHLGFSALRAISPTGRSRPFHADADGLLPAEGAGFVVLKRYRDALRDGDRVYGIIRGIGLSNDGRTAGLLTPSAAEQEVAIRSAYQLAGLEPADISLLECHATGTPVGDSTELKSSSRVFGAQRGLPIGSIKSNLGHPLTAAGIAGLIKLLGALESRTLPRMLHVQDDRAVDGAFRLLTRNEAWESAGPRRAALSGFGFGGNNAHLIVEEAAGQTFSSSVWKKPERCRIALVGLGATAGSAAGLEQFRAALFSKKLTTPRLETIALPLEGCGFPPVDFETGLPQQALAMSVAMEAVSQVRLPGDAESRRRVGVFVGAGCDPNAARGGLLSRHEDRIPEGTDPRVLPPWTASGVVGRLLNIVANRISNAHDLRGPSFTVSSEEHSGLTAVDLACHELRAGRLDAALAGAVDLSCEPVHESAAAGVVAGDGAVFFLLKRLSDAERDGDRVLAEVDGAGDVTESLAEFASTVFGKPHAAVGLMEAAAAAITCAHGVGVDGRPGTGEEKQVEVAVRSTGGHSKTIRMGKTNSAMPLVPAEPPRVFFAAGESREEIKRQLPETLPASNAPANGTMRLAIVAANEQEWRRKRDRALQVLASSAASFSADGVHFRERAMEGELAFVFPGAASSYAGAGSSLFAAFPEVFEGLLDTAPKMRPWVRWLFDAKSAAPGPSEKLAASTILCQAHAKFTRGWLGLKPAAAIGMSAGETNSLLAMDVWRETDQFFLEFEESGVFSRYLSGAFEVSGGKRWESWIVLVPEAKLREVMEREPGLRILAIHTPGEYLIAGDAETCARAVSSLGRNSATLVDFPAIIHCRDLAPFEKRWRELHHRPTWQPPDGVRMYQMHTGRVYEITRDSVADALTAQALHTLDYPRVIEQAWKDGVRVFLEHGARGSCTSWIRRILGEREHVAIALDSPIADALTQAVDAIAQLVVAGVPVDVTKVIERITPRAAASKKPVIQLAAHAPVPVLAAPVVEAAPMFEAEEQEVGVAAAASAMAPVSAAGASLFEQHVAALKQQHSAFLEASERGHQTFLETSRRALARFMHCGVGGEVVSTPVETTATNGHAAPQVQIATPQAPAAAVVAKQQAPAAVSAPMQPVVLPPVKKVIFDRAQLEETTRGKISNVFGKQFESIDQYKRICRLPMPPMLLVDRVTHLEGEPGSMGLGVMHTETDVREDSWFLLNGRIPTGLMIEAGQADMLLISWLGIDFHVKGERVYRMLGCEVTFKDQLAKPGETLRYEIRITGHARQGGIRIFFFEYDCYIGTRLALTVRNGQAGFFSNEELANSVGILWDPATAKPLGTKSDPAPSRAIARTFTKPQVLAAARGDAWSCFGEGFETAAAMQRPPCFAELKLLQFETVSELDFTGGPWGRGYVRADSIIDPNSFLFTSHFLNDPCLPGTVMLEGCYQLMAFYMMAMGLTLNRDGWRFEPVLDEKMTVLCRGQVLPTSREVICEVFIDEFRDGAEPVLFADTLGIVDGQRAFHGHRLGLRLVPGHLLDDGSRKVDYAPRAAYPRKAPVTLNGVRLDEEAMLSTAWGAPSNAFGPPYARFDGTERCPRLPGPPYEFVSRVVGIEGEFGVEKAGCAVEAEYDVEPSAWYFRENSNATMPYSVLLEVGLQPCGWLSCFTGVPLSSASEVFFRNLDGAAKIHREVPAEPAVISTKARLKNLSRFGAITLVTLDVAMTWNGEPLLDMTTSFGFFSKADLEGQVGLPPTAEEAARFAQASEFYCDLRPEPARYFEAPLRIANGSLRMIDEITGLWPDAEGLTGRVRARKNLSPNDWFFKAHFFGDPVQPGSLGLEAILQTLQFYVIERGIGSGVASPRFELLSDSTWKYRGQAVPRNQRVEVEVRILEVTNDLQIHAEGWLWVDGLRVYHMPKFGLRILQS